jgi:ribulose-phosphate 3-epimerase
MPGTELIAPSILSADFARLGEEVERVLAAGADLIHFDVMDNHYVPNLTIGPLICAALRKHGITAPIDVHLMVKPVDRIIPDFGRAGATYITFHPEASEHVDRTIGLIRESGAKPGLVFNPATPLDWLDHTLEKLDMVLLMSVNPGFAGQKFITSVLTKLEQVRSRIDASARGAPGDRRRREGRQHRRDCPRGCRHVRSGIGDLREPGLRDDDPRDAGGNRQGATQPLTTGT